MKRLFILFICLILITFSGCKSKEPPEIEIQTELSDYCYNIINDVQKDMYQKILTAAMDMEEGRVLLTSVGENVNENINIAYSAVSVDHPEIFWLSGKYQVVTFNEEKVYIYIGYEMDKTSRAAGVAALNKRVENILEATKDMSAFEKEIYFHNYLCDNVTYTADGVYTRYTAFGALVNNKAVCEGYSRAMQLLCKKAGINCSLVKGTVKDEAHMWNIIELSGEWYETDVTWSDTENELLRYNYFNLTSEQMRQNHTPYPIIDGITEGVSLKGSKYNLTLPECVSVRYGREKAEKIHEELFLEKNIEN